ncbi:respiratory nitrate reductase subunit gamma [Virgibacillus alimentarius]|uniref:Nitrate reductase gamma subunit n=1 Tax=Virgibacillus alimentarius TaxID=698769 RepID=A0ABS4SCA7_9BACI|nr:MULTISPECIES: respiratory nitrate reductase subunit gamma [Virgibacillus]MBP2258529.1 nitrate reductase gamma subunit [Virgibacillus alimentarius]HLR67475.1 respiratory nitrate reductase subunit gamma [Virgibacillus sp.]
MAAIFWWVIFPYITLTIMVLGLLYRFAFRQLSWAAPSTEFFEKKWLRIGSPLFHWGIIFAFLGHVMGMVIPKGFYDFFGISDELYHAGAIIGGGIAALMVVVGLIILLIRKMKFERVRAHATFASFFSLIALIIVAGLGTYMTIIYNTTVVSYEYRTTIGPWFRSLFIFQPKYHLMESVPFVFKAHVIAAFALFAAIPFTNLIHFYTLPLGYPGRAPQQYRSRSNYRKKGL